MRDARPGRDGVVVMEQSVENMEDKAECLPVPGKGFKVCDKFLLVQDHRSFVGLAYADYGGKIRKSPLWGGHVAFNPELGKEDSGGLDPIRLHTRRAAYVIRGNNDKNERTITQAISRFLEDNILYAERMKTEGERHHNILVLEPLYIIDASKEHSIDEIRRALSDALRAKDVPPADIDAIVSIVLDPYGPGAHLYLHFGHVVISRVVVHSELPGGAVSEVLGSYRRRYIDVHDMMRLLLASKRLTLYR